MVEIARRNDKPAIQLVEGKSVWLLAETVSRLDKATYGTRYVKGLFWYRRNRQLVLLALRCSVEAKASMDQSLPWCADYLDL